MPNQYAIDDLGVIASGNAWMSWHYVKHPTTGAEIALGAMSKCGFVLFDPRTRETIHVRNSMPESECWSAVQAPDGSIFAALYGSGEVLHWNWKGDEAEVVGKIPGLTIFTLDVAPDGRVYLPNASSNHLWRYDPHTRKAEDLGDFNALGEHLRHVCCGSDGMVYVTCNTYGKGTELCVFNPATGTRDKIQPLNSGDLNWQTGSILKDAVGHVLLPYTKYGRTYFHELVGGRTRAIAQDQIRLAPGNLALAFSDGSYMTVQNREEAFDEPTNGVFVDARGARHEFNIARPEFPLRIFSVESGADRIWCGTFIPLRLATFNPATGEKIHLGNPAKCTGEIYNMVFSHGKLYMASYTSAPVTRYIPDKPWRKDDGIFANPAHLGYMKETGGRLQRPHGRAIDPAGRVFFAALGDYGCFDSGICRIDPDTDELTRWIYTNTFMDALTHVRSTDQLLVSERRRGEKPIRFTLVSPEDGKEIWSEPMINDNGCVVSWLDDGGDLIYGLHSYRATIFAFSISQRKIVAECKEMRFGEHCNNTLMFGPDGKIWGLTNEAVWSINRDLTGATEVAEYRGNAYKNANRYGMVTGPDGGIYFANGPRLMRVRKA